MKKDIKKGWEGEERKGDEGEEDTQPNLFHILCREDKQLTPTYTLQL